MNPPTRLHVGDVIGNPASPMVVVKLRRHSIHGRLEAWCQPVDRFLQGVFVTVSARPVFSPPSGTQLSTAAFALRRIAAHYKKHARRAKLDRTAGIWLRHANRLARQADRLLRLQVKPASPQEAAA